MFGKSQIGYAMKLTAADRPWAPLDHPEYLCLLQGRQPPPVNVRQLLDQQARLLRRLWLQSDQREKEQANLKLRNNLAPEVLDALPSGLFQNPRTSRQLFDNPVLHSSPLHQWEVDFESLSKLPPMPPQEARQEAQGLDLESFLSRLL